MTDKEINEINLRINKICFGQDFVKYFTDKFKFCPNGLTVDFYEDITKSERYILTPCIKIYGYEHSCNNGVSEYSDASDFEYGNFNLTGEMYAYVLNYFNNDEIIKQIFITDNAAKN